MSELAGADDPGLRTGERRGAKKTRPAAWTEFRGVYRRRSGKYGAQVRDLTLETNIWLGTFNTAEDAARAYDAAAVKLRGTAAKTNFKQPAAIDAGGVSSFLHAPAEPSGHGVHRQPSGEYIAQVCDSKGRAALSPGGIGSPSMRHDGLSVDVPWQQVAELLTDMESSDVS